MQETNYMAAFIIETTKKKFSLTKFIPTPYPCFVTSTLSILSTQLLFFLPLLVFSPPPVSFSRFLMPVRKDERMKRK
jgi:hypothetical protein